ncbi:MULTISPECIES: DUF3429 domain-containing protein [unclassified Sphingomonas]|uniref:DUF3429 domain-containing protein n=1 Tax=unclassified Sphingomonas TaxID=196159 RepID=UPI00226AFC05|nr:MULTISPECIES: DUF3429 domain-containing protein [unclassified Sphingomonas]
MNDRPTTATPTDGIILGYGPMIPLVVAALGAWILPDLYAYFAVQAGIIWGALILAFIAGVRRGYGFGSPGASTAVSIATSIGYFVLAGLGLAIGRPSHALLPLILGYVLAAMLDRRAALAGDAPPFFATLRPIQLLIGAAGLAGLWAWTIGR